MSKNVNKSIPLTDAIRAIERAIYEDEWIDRLSHREWFLIEKYPPPSDRPAPTIRFPGSGLTVVDMVFPPSGSLLEGEWIAAYTKAAFKRSQKDKALTWLRNAGFDTGQEVIDRAAFKRVYRAKFGNAKPGRAARDKRDRHASASAVEREVNRYLVDERAKGHSFSQKRAWATVKKVLFTASYRQVIDALPKRRRGRPRREDPA